MDKLFYLWLKITSLLPMKLLNILAIKFSVVLLIIRYRKKVITDNLRNSFPNYSKTKIIETKSSIYKYLGQLISESIKAISISKKEIESRIVFTNPELIKKYLDQNKDVIMVLGHYGNWEWALLATSNHFDKELVGIYKPLSSKFWDDKLKKIRGKFGATLVSMNESYRYIFKNKQQPKILGIIADQTPSTDQLDYWTTFLNQETPVFLGTEKLAKKLNCPVIYTHIKPISRGNYSISYELITDKPQNYGHGEITDMYCRLLELKISNKPQYWLWSHRRWKHKQK